MEEKCLAPDAKELEVAYLMELTVDFSNNALSLIFTMTKTAWVYEKLKD